MGILSRKNNDNSFFDLDEENKKLRETVSNLRIELENYKNPP